MTKAENDSRCFFPKSCGLVTSILSGSLPVPMFSKKLATLPLEMRKSSLVNWLTWLSLMTPATTFSSLEKLLPAAPPSRR